MAIETSDAVRVTAVMNFMGSDEMVNVYHVHVTDDNSQSQANIYDDIAEYLEAIYSPLIGAMPTQVTFEQIEFFNVSKDTPEAIINWPTLTAGTVSGEFLPEGVSCLMFARTIAKGVLGRKFMPVFTEGNYTAGLWTAATLVAMGTSAAAWITQFTGTNGVVLTPGVWRKAYNIMAFFTEAVIRNIPAYQRRRKRNVGA